MDEFAACLDRDTAGQLPPDLFVTPPSPTPLPSSSPASISPTVRGTVVGVSFLITCGAFLFLEFIHYLSAKLKNQRWERFSKDFLSGTVLEATSLFAFGGYCVLLFSINSLLEFFFLGMEIGLGLLVGILVIFFVLVNEKRLRLLFRPSKNEKRAKSNGKSEDKEQPRGNTVKHERPEETNPKTDTKN